MALSFKRSTGRRNFLTLLGTASLGALAVACGGAAPTNTPAPAKPAAPAPAAAATTAPAAAATKPAAAAATTAPAAAATKPAAAATTAPAAAQPAAAKPGQTTLEYWSNWAPADPATKVLNEKMFPAFEQANPGIKIRHEYVATTGNTQAAEKLLTAINGGTPPDANYFDRFIVTSWAAQGFLTDVTANAQADKLSQEKFLKEAWDEATFQKKLFATPFTTDFRMLYYNKKHFTEAGLDPAKPPTTIAELDTYAEKLNKKDGSKFTRMGFIPWAYQGWLYTYGWLWGGEFYDPAKNTVTANDPKIVAALDWMAGYAKKFGVDAVDSFASAFRTQQGSFASNDQDGFVLGMVSMVTNGDWNIATWKQYMKPDDYAQFDVTPIPQAPGGPKTSSWGGGWSIVLPKGLKNKDQAWKFANWFATEGQKVYTKELLRVPTLLELFDEKNFAAADPRWKKFLALKDIVRFRPNIPAGQTLWTELATAQDAAIHGKGSSKDLLDGVTDRTNKELAKFK